MLRRKFLLRVKQIKNAYQIENYDISFVKISILNLNLVSMKNLFKKFTALKLIMQQQPMFLRLKKTQIRLNLKKGLPIGVFVSLFNKNKTNFLKIFKWKILPQINKNWILKNKKNTIFLFSLENIFVFSNLKPFFFHFNNFFKIQISLNLKKKSRENFFVLRYYQIPFKQ